MTILVIRGERYVTLQDVAESFEVELTWVQAVYDFGLLGSGEAVGGTVAIASRLLDRMAEIQRMHRVQGLDLAGIAVLLDDGRDAP